MILEAWSVPREAWPGLLKETAHKQGKSISILVAKWVRTL